MSRERVELRCCKLRPKEVRLQLGRSPLFHAAFYPYLCDPMTLPVGKKTDAVATGENVIQVAFQLSHGQILVHHLPHLKRRLHVKRDLRYHAKSTQSNHCPSKAFTIA